MFPAQHVSAPSLGTPFPASSGELYNDLASRYDLREKNIAIAGKVFTILMVRDTNVLFDAIDPAAFAVDERIPYWAELWPSGVELAEVLLSSRDVRGKTMLEIGCGLGLPGIAAASRGAFVAATDFEVNALAFARYNALTNLPPEMCLSNITFDLLDWRSARSTAGYDMLLAADVVYERRHFRPILEIVRSSLNPGGVALFTEPDRSIGRDFFAMAEHEGFSVERTARPCRGGSVSTIVLAEIRNNRC